MTDEKDLGPDRLRAAWDDLEKSAIPASVPGVYVALAELAFYQGVICVLQGLDAMSKSMKDEAIDGLKRSLLRVRDVEGQDVKGGEAAQ